MADQLVRRGGAEHIASAIRAAVADGKREATITGRWEIDEAVRIPGGFTLILDGCCLVLADGCFCNMFVNEHHDTELGRTAAGTDRDIAILGKNGAVLDGGTYNGLSEKTQRKDGLPPVWKNNLVLFTNVERFEVSGLSCRNQRWWALNFVYCSHGRLHDLDFCACDIGVDAEGRAYHGLKRDRYAEVLVKNADGIDLRRGCHDITIENITGFTEDDSIALTGLNGKLEQAFAVADLPEDICNITIRNVATAAFCSNVRLLSQGGVKLHDILIDGVSDTSAQSPHMDRGGCGVRIGDMRLYGPRHASDDETFRITIRNVRSRAAIAAICLAGGMKDVVWEGIESFDGAAPLEDLRTPPSGV